jgi:hypothetical protein
MTEVMTQERAARKATGSTGGRRHRDRQQSGDPSRRTRQNIARLTVEAVIEQRSDGHYDRTRLRYIKHLHAALVAGEADAAHVGSRPRCCNCG